MLRYKIGDIVEHKGDSENLLRVTSYSSDGEYLCVVDNIRRSLSGIEFEINLHEVTKHWSQVRD